MTRGIDVSKWNGVVDFNKVKASGYDFVILNAGYGRYISQKDPTFERNYANAKAAGLGVGAYWFSYATTAADAKKEANVFLEAIKGKSFEYPLAYDIEHSSQSILSNTVIGNTCKSFCDVLEKAGYYVCLYSYASFLSNKIPANVLSKYDVWVANFTTADKPFYNGVYGMWQHSDKGCVNGISGSVDLNIAYKDYPTIMKQNGFNGFEKIKIEPGDVNSDGVVNVTDVNKIAAHVKGKRALTGDELKRADVNGDGVVNVTDAMTVTAKVKSISKTESPKPAESWTTYTVKKGDTLYAIAKKFGVSVVDIAKDNNIKNINLIYVSQKLRIKTVK
jgi:GH25 family lysozyme M1 (1,4-beta-N-acetylmuramidase)